jgi:hypothetical protein
MTGMYNVLEQLRRGEALSPLEAEETLLSRLVALNAERTAEEEAAPTAGKRPWPKALAEQPDPATPAQLARISHHS